MEAHPARPVEIERAEAGAGAMLVACRLAGLSTLETLCAGQSWRAMRCRVWLRGLWLACAGLGQGDAPKARVAGVAPVPGAENRHPAA
jgi:hypothetical protein